jgi:hypothetical protein
MATVSAIPSSAASGSGAVIAVARRRLSIGYAGVIHFALVVGVAIFGTCLFTILSGVRQ